MKANDFILVASVFAALLSCTREPLPPRQIGPSSFSATLDESTKSIIDGITGKWTDGDAIALYSGGQNTGVVYSTSLAEPSTSAVFSGSGAVQAADGKYYAIYPASAISGNWFDGTEGSKYNEGNARVEVPSEQHPASCGYDPKANIMCASSSSTSFTFHHLVGYVKFTIGPSSPKNIVKVIVTERNGKTLAAKTFAKTNLESPSLEALSGNNSEVVFKNSDDSPLAEGTYYIALIPRTFSQGLTFNFYTSDSKYSILSITRSISLTRGQIQNIGTVRNLVLKSIPAVGDVYKENEVAKGVVVRVDEGSRKAYVMSITDAAKAKWSSPTTYNVGTSNESNDGASNTKLIQDYVTLNSLDFSTAFPAAYQCVNYGTGDWYLMSKSDWSSLNAIYNFNTAEGRSDFNNLLTTAGGSAILDATYYWTSTESTSDNTKIVCARIKASDSKPYTHSSQSKNGSDRPARAMLTLTF